MKKIFDLGQFSKKREKDMNMNFHWNCFSIINQRDEHFPGYSYLNDMWIFYLC